MQIPLPSNVPSLLDCCAILLLFDRATLLAFGHDEQALATLLDAGHALPIALLPGAFELQHELRQPTLARLQAEHPEQEFALHELAFAHFLERLQGAIPAQQRQPIEDCCIHHLDAMRLVLQERRDWRRFEQYITALRASRLQQAHHQHRLTLFEGLIAVHTPDYPRAEATLNGLLAEEGVEPEVRMRTMNVLAQAHWYQADYDRARRLYEQVHNLASATGNDLFQGFALINMSLIDHELTYYQRALTLSSQGLERFRIVGDVYQQAHALYEIGKNLMQLGRWQEAQQRFHEAGRLYDRLGVQAQRANLYCLQGMLFHALGDEAQSESWYLRSLEIGQSPEHGDQAITMDAYLLLGLLYQTQEYRAQALHAYQRAIELAQLQHNQYAHALALYRRGTVLQTSEQIDAALEAYRDAIDQVEKLRSAAQSEDIKLGLLGATQQIYEAIVLLLLAQGQHAEAYQYVERARSRAFLDLVAEKSPELRARYDYPVARLAEIQALLPDDAMVIEYYTTGVTPGDEHLLSRLADTNRRLLAQLVLTPRVVIFAITRTHFEVRETQLNPNLIRPQANDPQPGRRWLQDRKLRALYTHLIEPVEHLLKERRQIFLIPHGPLHHIPFMALRAASGAPLLDHDGPVLALAPSATVLVRHCLGRTRRQDGVNLALGYDDAQVGLQHAEREARAVAAITGGEAWTGPARKSKQLFAAAPRLRALHIAGHAIYEPNDPLGSYLSLGIDDHLTARMIMRDLSLQADLVTLSACTSGLSQIVPGDELLGLLRSWLYAGTGTLVCALWETSDIVARIFMERFYRALGAGGTCGTAFRDAAVGVRDMTGRELATTFARWRREDVEQAAGFLPEVPPELYDRQPYADAQTWASFMLIGRP